MDTSNGVHGNNFQLILVGYLNGNSSESIRKCLVNANDYDTLNDFRRTKLMEIPLKLSRYLSGTI